MQLYMTSVHKNTTQ